MGRKSAVPVKAQPEEKKPAVFTREQLMKSRRYVEYRDVLMALLPNASVTLAQADALIKEFKNRKVD